MPISLYEQVRALAKSMTPHGRYFSALCPFHNDNSPSLLVYSDGFYCMGCRRRGGLSRLVRALKGTDFSATSSEPISPYYFPKHAHPEEIALIAHDAVLAFPDLTTYLCQRKVDSRVEPNLIGWFNGWYTIPVYDERSNFKSLVMRAGPDLQKRKNWRYVISPGAEPSMYVPDWPLIHRENRVIVVYGIFDALSLAAARIPVVTGTHGKKFHADWLADHRKRIIIVPDKGEEEEAHLLASGLGWRAKVAKVVYPEGCKDPNDLMMKGQERYLLGLVA